MDFLIYKATKFDIHERNEQYECMKFKESIKHEILMYECKYGSTFQHKMMFILGQEYKLSLRHRR